MKRTQTWLKALLLVVVMAAFYGTPVQAAFDGTPSKVIGLDGQESFNQSYYDTNNVLKARATLVQDSSQYYSPLLPETQGAYLDAASGLYVYGGKYYQSCQQAYEGTSQNFVYLYNPVTFCSTSVVDETTGLAKVNGKYYRRYHTADNDQYYVVLSEQAVYLGTYDTTDAMLKALGRKVDSALTSYNYYEANGKYYKEVNYIRDNNKYMAFAYVKNEISFNGSNAYISWNRVTTENTITTSDGQLLYVGYQVERNGSILSRFRYGCSITKDGKFFVTDNSCTDSFFIGNGKSASYRVRAVYYTESIGELANGRTKTEYSIYKTGPWSETYTFTCNVTTPVIVPAVTLSAKQVGEYVNFDWNSYDRASQYQIEYIQSSHPMNVTQKTWNDYHTNSSDALDALRKQYPKFTYTYSQGYPSVSQYRLDLDTSAEYRYLYAVVYISSTIGEDIINNRSYSNVVALTLKDSTSTPKLNLKAETNINGNVRLMWNPVDANVIIYAYEKKDFPTDYYYNKLNAYGTVVESWGTSTAYYSNHMDKANRKLIDNKVKVYDYIDGDDGEFTPNNLEYGKTYYFIAHTYDTSRRDESRAAIRTVNNIKFTNYNDLSSPSNVVSGKVQVSKPEVHTSSAKNSIKLSMSGGSTGYEIYKLSGKKYKKIATTVDNYYVDEKLSANKTYSYKVRSYHINEDTKKKAYSDYVYVSAVTGTVNGVMLTAKKTSIKSVKLSWDKVKGASKIEIYRSNEYSGDPSVCYEKYGEEGYPTFLESKKYQLIKTLKGSAKSFTNKGLTNGEDYSYVIFVYYKSGGKTTYVTDGVWVSMSLDTPIGIKAVNKGTKATVSWTKDPYAKKYEVAYRKYDKEGYATSVEYTIATTKKNSYTVAGIESGGYVEVKVRAIGKNGRYSSWSSTKQGTSLAGAKKVTAKNVNIALDNGNKQPAVKITWKKVSGAKYYKVYRSTKKPTYYADTKMYVASGTLIAKEANDDEINDTVKYDQYHNVSGSITKTSVVDRALLQPGVNYYYTVVAYGPYNTKIASYATSSAKSYEVGSGSYGQVTYGKNFALTAKATKKKVTLKWSKLEGSPTFTVYRSMKKNGKYQKVGTVKKGKTTFVDKKVKKGKTYYYKVKYSGKSWLLLNSKYTLESQIVKVKVPKK